MMPRCAKFDALAANWKARCLGSAARRSRRPLRIESNFTKARYVAAVRKAKSYIRAGDIFQVVPSQRFSAQDQRRSVRNLSRVAGREPFALSLLLEARQRFGGGQFSGNAGESPGTQLPTIARSPGTVPRGRTEAEDRALEAKLLADPKERAEHIMLVDLGRNDLGRVCEYGSVTVERLMFVERYSHVMHLVSSLRGQLRADVDCFDALMACFPAGTLSGAPKVRAMQIIDELEPTRRGIYAGAIMYWIFPAISIPASRCARWWPRAAAPTFKPAAEWWRIQCRSANIRRR